METKQKKNGRKTKKDNKAVTKESYKHQQQTTGTTERTDFEKVKIT